MLNENMETDSTYVHLKYKTMIHIMETLDVVNV